MKPIVVDANVFVALFTAMPYSRRAEELVTGWRRSGVPLFAPLLWEYELTSVFRKTVAAGVLPMEDATAALSRCLRLAVQRVAPDLALHQGALRWAGKLGQFAAYDAQYLALAERLGAEFWTADKRVAERARQVGVTWVREVTA